MLEELFKYNWMVREEWITWCKTLPDEELLKKRVGGMGSFLDNLFHVIDCEQLWVNQMRRTPVIVNARETINGLDDITRFSTITKKETADFLNKFLNGPQNGVFSFQLKSGVVRTYPHQKILYHIITHETHHIGQLSVWAREIGLPPVPSDLLIKDGIFTLP